MLCNFCNKEYSKARTGPVSVFCSEQCRRKKAHQNKYLRKERSCFQCNTPITGSAYKFCSLICKEEYNKLNPKQRPHTCIGCSTQFNARHNNQTYCSTLCRSKWARKKALGEINCKTCSNSFIPTPDTYLNYCSDECKLASKRADWVKNNVKRQTVVNSTPMSERVNTAEIFARDNNTCQICGIKTSREGGQFSSDYPTIDHIIPISKGGQHVYGNLQCACRRCNMSKGAKVAS